MDNGEREVGPLSLQCDVLSTFSIRQNRPIADLWCSPVAAVWLLRSRRSPQVHSARYSKFRSADKGDIGYAASSGR